MIPFEKTSYAVQVRRLRKLAVRALKAFALDVSKPGVSKIEFINHGENATFKVTSSRGDKFLLRIHRLDYHTKPALHEEIKWLDRLSREGLQVPRPAGANARSSLLKVEHPEVGARYCDLFHWIDGRFLSKSISKSDMFEIGQLLAKTQKVGRKISSTQRRYWTSEGLVGTEPKFGSIDQVVVASAAQQKKLTSIRRAVLSRLKKYEKRYPEKMGLIHADLHFGNLLKSKDGSIAAIDFDDCGYGFFAYDLVVPLVSVQYRLREHKRMRDYPKLKQALINGYSSLAELNDRDLAVMEDLFIARKLMMIGWLNSRSDNPKLKKRLRQYVPATLKEIEKLKGAIP